MPLIGTPAGQPFGPDWQLRALIARQHYGAHVTGDVRTLLESFYDEMAARLANGTDLADWKRDRLQGFTRWAGARLAEVGSTARDRSSAALAAFGAVESDALRQQANSLRLLAGMPSRSQLISTARFGDVVRTADIGGIGFGEWWQRDAVTSLLKAKTTIQQHLLLGSDYRAIARVVVSRKPSDVTLASTHIGRARTAVRTAMTAVSTHAANMEHAEMTDVIRVVRFEAVLDARTSDVCKVHDDEEYPVNAPDIPQPPLHPNCRSALVPVPRLAVLGVSQLDLGKRATYDEWLTAQPERVQNDVLGKGRAALYRAGTISLGDLIAKDGRSLSLAELRAKHAAPVIAPRRVVTTVLKPTPPPAPPPPPPVRDAATFTRDVRAAMTEAARAHDALAAQAKRDYLDAQSAWTAMGNALAMPGGVAPTAAALDKQLDLVATHAAIVRAYAAERTTIVRKAFLEEMRTGALEQITAAGAARGAPVYPTVTPVLKKGAKALLRQDAKAASEFLNTLLPNPAATPLTVDVVASRQRRSNFQARPVTPGAIGAVHMSSHATAAVYVHEFVHAFEAAHPEAGAFGRFARAFFSDGQPARVLPAYIGDGHNFYRGHYLHPYMGKDYASGARGRPSGATHTEMLSVTLEELYRDPSAVLAAHPALFDMTIDFLRRWRTWTPPTTP